MKAMRCMKLGEPLEWVTCDDPIAQPGQALIRVAACGVNFADTLMIKGQYQEKPQIPFTPGFEVAGIIEDLGDESSSFNVGDRVVAMVSHGGYAQRVCAPFSMISKIPDQMDAPTAASMLIAYGTSYVGLVNRANLKKDEVVLIHGAAGGVGLTAVEVAKQWGARVVVTASSEEKLDIARAHGAHDAFLSSHHNWAEKIKETVGKVDVVYDPVGGDLFHKSLKCTGVGGRILLVGFASGDIPQIPANILLVKNITCIGYYYGGWIKHCLKDHQQCLSDVFNWWEKGHISPRLDHQIPLQKAQEALDLIRHRRVRGKVVLLVD